MITKIAENLDSLPMTLEVQPLGVQRVKDKHVVCLSELVLKSNSPNFSIFFLKTKSQLKIQADLISNGS